MVEELLRGGMLSKESALPAHMVGEKTSGSETNSGLSPRTQTHIMSLPVEDTRSTIGRTLGGDVGGVLGRAPLSVPNPPQIFYNKVPKCGSTTLCRVLRTAAEDNGVKIKRRHIFGGRHLTEKDEVRFTLIVKLII